ncbi:winged helix-turn-helix domain-containing protein [Pleionea sp. CnH1-48]|uniref:winged helix-turn-helix domain-containing protein n=1 Tax=Pleionea sp. CnH1-48 TaxID=2954494 RepID=UPI0020985EBA|nr:winged helix-turn-helix domain-containing protein [Pleionea sp. CnH1-48]MCO7224791.1 winged helix-turn-helix domain-containing protein [Pleionea sp. CnH1-48]
MPKSDFRTNQWLVKPSENKISYQEEHYSIEPLAMEVLLYLSHRQGEVISRDELIEQVWKGKIVGDHAIYRIINQLRKIFEQHSEEPFITTIRKKGYQWLQPIEPCTESQPERETTKLTKEEDSGQPEAQEPDADIERPAAQEPFRQPSNNATKKTGIAFVFLALIVLFFVGTSQFWSSDNTLPQFTRFKSFSNLSGEEQDPSYSHDGSTLAFSHKAYNSNSWDIYTQSLDGHLLQQITQSAANDLSPEWAPDGKSLVFFRYQDDKCFIMQATLTETVPEVSRLLECFGTIHGNSMQWSKDGKILYFTSSRSYIDPYRLFAWSTETQQKEPLTNPSPGKSKGEVSIALSPDGKSLAFVRDTNWGDTEVHLMNLSDQSSHKLFALNGMKKAISWSKDSRHIIYSGAKNSIKAYSLDNQKSYPIATNSQPIRVPAFAPHKDQLAVVSGQGALDIWRSANTRKAAPEDMPIVISSIPEFYPIYANNSEDIAFVSKRTGKLQVWLRKANGEEFPLTQFSRSHPIRRLRWSPDDKHLLTHRKDKLLIINAETGAYHKLETPEHWDNIETASWSNNGLSIYFSSSTEGDWQIYQVSVDQPNQIEAVTRQGGYSAQECPQGGCVYYLKYHEPGLWKIENGEETRVLEDIDVFSSNGWKVTESGVYYISNNKQSGGVRFKAFDGTESELLLPMPPEIKHFSISADEQWFIYPKILKSESSIILLEPGSH